MGVFDKSIMPNETALLAALQHSDSFFPNGAIAFSWGLETLRADQAVTSVTDLGHFIAGQLSHRWATCDRPALIAAYRLSHDLEQVVKIDEEVDALALPREMREGGRRAGAALLSIHEKLGTPQAATYRQWVRARKAPGQLAVVQGLVWSGAGLSENVVDAVSAHTLCVGLIGAALRLGMIGHVDGQKILCETRALIVELLQEPPPQSLSAYTPAAEIAIMRHETQDGRLFAN